MEIGKIIFVLESDDGESHFFNVFSEFGAKTGLASN